jgi:hypothetical protein
MKWIKLFEEFNENISELINILKKYNVPVDLWGMGKSKTIQHLQDELIEKECSLVEKENQLIRYIEFVGIKIYFRDQNNNLWALKEDRQEFKDGRVRRRNMPNSVSEKMKFGEDPAISAIRGIKEELGIDVEKDQLIKRRDLDYNGGSLSYPGLITKYKGHKFTCYLNINQFDINGYIEVQRDKSTFFVWKKIN